ncbi:hypothetical protein NGM37_55340 [Streptomyces sp. TRM76130]|nr:hypothetical protein [Streptomyces sp. TRM76130]
MSTSVVDLREVGTGPSGSHPVGPVRAAHSLADGSEQDGPVGESTSMSCLARRAPPATAVTSWTSRPAHR